MKRQQEDQHFLAIIRPIKADHPFWGYRRVWSYMKYRLHIPVNKKRIYRIMKESSLLVQKNQRLKAKRGKYPYRRKPQAQRPNEFWGTDMTKVMIPSFGWLYLVLVLDWHTKKIVGYSISDHSRADDWLAALNNACNSQFPQGILSKKQTLHLISDNGSQPTSERFMRACSVMEIKQIFASYSNPKGNADTERVMRTIKEDLVWPNEFTSVDNFKERFKQWCNNYNTDYPHSSLGYLTPVEFEKERLLITTKN